MALGDFPKKTLVQCTSENVLPMISFGSFMVSCLMCKYFFFFFSYHFIFFNLILFLKLYIIVLVLPNIKMNPPQVYMCSPP